MKVQVSKLRSMQKQIKVLRMEIPNILHSIKFFITHHINLACRTANFCLSDCLTSIKCLPGLLISRLKISLCLDLCFSWHLDEVDLEGGGGEIRGINQNCRNGRVNLIWIHQRQGDLWALLSQILSCSGIFKSCACQKMHFLPLLKMEIISTAHRMCHLTHVTLYIHYLAVQRCQVENDD